jgi:sensor histidine kinase regulating citrate/malate metabolism
MNLIKNAIEALSEKDDKKITLKTSQTDKKVYIEITDNGIGIDKDNLTNIFSFGFTTKPNGHGYGLHHSANLAKEIGGDLTAVSEGKNKGSTFRLCIPMTKDSSTKIF